MSSPPSLFYIMLVQLSMDKPRLLTPTELSSIAESCKASSFDSRIIQSLLEHIHLVTPSLDSVNEYSTYPTKDQNKRKHSHGNLNGKNGLQDFDGIHTLIQQSEVAQLKVEVEQLRRQAHMVILRQRACLSDNAASCSMNGHLGREEVSGGQIPLCTDLNKRIKSFNGSRDFLKRKSNLFCIG